MQRDFQPTTYIMTSARNGTLYIGATSNLIQRIAQHRSGSFGGFTAKYEVTHLVWFEQYATGTRHHPRETAEKMEPRVEDPADRGR